MFRCFSTLLFLNSSNISGLYVFSQASHPPRVGLIRVSFPIWSNASKHCYFQWFLSSSLIFLSNGEHKQFPFILNRPTLQPPIPHYTCNISPYIHLFMCTLQRDFIYKFPNWGSRGTTTRTWEQVLHCLLCSHWTGNQLWLCFSGSVDEETLPSLNWFPWWMTKRENSNPLQWPKAELTKTKS